MTERIFLADPDSETGDSRVALGQILGGIGGATDWSIVGEEGDDPESDKPPSAGITSHRNGHAKPVPLPGADEEEYDADGRRIRTPLDLGPKNERIYRWQARPGGRVPGLTKQNVISAVSRWSGISMVTILGETDPVKFARLRYKSAFLLRYDGALEPGEITKIFRRPSDHLALFGSNKIQARLKTDRVLQREMREIRQFYPLAVRRALRQAAKKAR